MRNTMDGIIVEYGGIDDARMCPLPEFLEVQGLSPSEQQTQKALKILYDLNQKHNLFKTDFPTSDGNPLLVRAGIAVGEDEYKDTKAHYVPLTHTISVLQEGIPTTELAVILAHEMEHARQMTPEVKALTQNPNINAFQMHQVGYAKEAQAFAFEKRVRSLLSLDNDYAEARTLLNVFKTEVSEKEIEQDLILHILPILYKADYKDMYDKRYPILESDKGLESFPAVLNVNEDIRKMLEKAPREARTPENRIRQAFANRKEEQIAPNLGKMSQEDIFLFCKGLADSNQESDLRLLVAVLSAKGKDGSYIISSQTVSDILVVQARNHNLKPMEPLFRDQDTTGQRRVPSKDFMQIITAVRYKKDMLINLFSKMNPQKYSADLALINRFETLYYTPQRTQSLYHTCGQEYA